MSWPNHGLPYSAGAFKNSRVLSVSMRVRTGALGESNICAKAQVAGHLKMHREAEFFPRRFDISYAMAH